MQAAPTISQSPVVTRPGWGLLIATALLLAAVQLASVGYQFGVGNQTIQVPFLEYGHNSSLFPHDVMVRQTVDQYPSYFFRWLAPGVSVVDVETLYLGLQVVITTAMFVAVGALVWSLFGQAGPALVLMLMLLAGHHRALAEELLYSTGVTHTWAVFPLIITALASCYAGRPALAFALTGFLFNWHALEAGHLALALGLWALASVRRVGWRKLMLWYGLFLLFASPTLLVLITRHQEFGPDWLRLMYVRSGHLSFPEYWWRPGTPDIPRFLMILALGGLATSLVPAGRHFRTTAWIMVGVGVMFIAGFLFTELWTDALFVRAQLFRSSRFALVLALAYVAAGCARGWRLPFEGQQPLSLWRRALEFGYATLVFLTLAVPAAMVLLPLTLAAGLVIALANRRLLWQQAIFGCVALFVALLAWRMIDFILPAISTGFSWARVLEWPAWPVWAWLAVLGVIGLWWFVERSPRRPGIRLAVLGTAALGVAALVQHAPSWRERAHPDEPWAAVQRWARANTPVDALFLTPPQMSGFRMLSQRSVVGEWRDGTQLYFSAAFAEPWWQRMQDLQPGVRIDPEGKRLLVQGRSLSELSDEQLVELATRYHATHVVVTEGKRRKLRNLYHNSRWAVYLPQFAPVTTARGDEELAEQARFLERVVQPRLETNRQVSASLQIVDPEGRPVYDLAYRLQQVGRPVAFGISGREEGALFDYCLVREPAWWSSIEPVEGQRDFTALDAVVEQARQAGQTIEFSFLTGFPPRWLAEKPPKDQRALLLQHVREVVARYAAVVAYWQVSDQEVFADQVPVIIRELRQAHPTIKLGVSVAGRFWSPFEEAQRMADLTRGLPFIRELLDRDVRLDFIAVHGHAPWGVWADLQTVGDVLGAYAATGLPIHVTEFAAPASGWMEGAIRHGQWTPSLQATYARWMFTAFYSHPAVAVVNYRADAPGAGDSAPVINTLRALLDTDWRTETSGVLALDGTIRWRGFAGDYELTLMPGEANPLTVNLTVEQVGEHRHRFVFDPAANTLQRMETP